MLTESLKFDLPKNQSSIIKVLGVGGGGSNAVNHMYKQGIQGVDFIVCNTDAQVLEISPVPLKIQLGASLTEGRGAGSIPQKGKNAAIESIDQIREILEKNTKMLFITAGMGGGTGTGAAPVIASVAKELGILTVGITTIPFAFEGRKRRLQAEEGIKELRKYVDTILIISNDKLRELYGNINYSKAFAQADNILTTAAKGIAEIITRVGHINVDFEDVNTVMRNSGVAIMGIGQAEGDNRAKKAVEMALSSPLLNDNEIKGASNILLNIAFGSDEILMDEVAEITDFVQSKAGLNADMIFGIGKDDQLNDSISVTLIATGFDAKMDFGYYSLTENNETKKIVHPLEHKSNVVTPVAKDEDVFPDFKLIQKEKENREEKPQLNLFNFENKGNPVQQTTLNLNFNLDDTLDTSKIIDNSEEQVIIKKAPSKITDEVKETKIENKEEITKRNNKEWIKRNSERYHKLNELSLKIKNPEEVQKMENVPAYIRRNIALNNVTPSNETEISKYTLTDDEEKKVDIKPNNKFLHDNVD